MAQGRRDGVWGQGAGTGRRRPEGAGTGHGDRVWGGDAGAGMGRGHRGSGAGAGRRPGDGLGVCGSQSVNSVSVLVGFVCSFGFAFAAGEPHSYLPQVIIFSQRLSDCVGSQQEGNRTNRGPDVKCGAGGRGGGSSRTKDGKHRPLHEGARKGEKDLWAGNIRRR